MISFIFLRYAPVGILFLIAGKIVEMGDIGQIGGQLAMYTLCVISGLLVHSLLVLPLLYFLATHRNPYVFIGGLLQALLTALGTSSRYMQVHAAAHCAFDWMWYLCGTIFFHSCQIGRASCRERV